MFTSALHPKCRLFDDSLNGVRAKHVADRHSLQGVRGQMTLCRHQQAMLTHSRADPLHFEPHQTWNASHFNVLKTSAFAISLGDVFVGHDASAADARLY